MKKIALIAFGIGFAALSLPSCVITAEGEGEGEGEEGEGEEGEGEEGEGEEGEGEEGEGEGGEGEGEPVEEITFCQATCDADADCTDPNPNDDLAVACDSETSTCVFEVGAGGGCTADNECVALFNGIQPCDAQDDCNVGTTCSTFDLQGEPFTGCGFDSTDVGAGPQCFFGVLTDAVRVSDNANIQVCINETAGTEDSRCDAGVCENPCNVDADCPQIAGFDQCREGGQCGCEVDDDCTGNAGGAFCRTDGPAAGFCGCAEDADCPGGEFDSCFEDSGTCGCSGEAVCTEAGEACVATGTFDEGDIDP